METHVPLPGVRVGDLGPKLGFGSVDNGWLELDHVVIRKSFFFVLFFFVQVLGSHKAHGFFG